MRNYFFKKEEKGISLIEVLTVMAVIGIFASIGVSGFFSFKKGNDFLLSIEQANNTIRLARMKALNGNNDDDWGVHITASQILVFKGNDFINRNISYDEVVSLSEVASVSGLTQIIFSKMSGLPSDVGVIYFNDGNQNKSIEINEKGMVIK
ncbi:MAG: prepilin-type N-terminal cleavage/methylation domain-containing protein [Candidatus Moraniibacteriota bacterium]|nr:MAG: prepilin-type N-terminal cleavage/methylation domain-containing protein [Candidatus Moranbacteria bacterium]